MSIKALPSMEHVFRVNVKGEETGKSYEGDFSYKRPNLRVDSEIEKTKALLDGGLRLSEEQHFIHEVLARLKHTITASPEWWAKSDYGFELYDLNVVLDIFKETKKFEKEWTDKVWAEDAKSETPTPIEAAQGK